MGEVFVGNSDADKVYVISDSTNAVVANVTLPEGIVPRDFAYDSAMGEVFVAGGVGSAIPVISDSSNKVVANVTVGTEPSGVAYDPAKGEVFVADTGSSAVSVISDAASSSTTTSSTAPEFPSGAIAVIAAVTMAFVALLSGKLRIRQLQA
jgi:YVTN family beta-propeller protein